MVQSSRKNLLHNFLQAYNSADAETAISFFADDAVWEDMALGQIFEGKKEITDFFNVAHADFTDLKWELKSIFSANNKAVFESVLSGIHTHSSFPEIPVAGKYIELKAATIVEFRDGKISRFDDYYDLPQFEQQSD